MSKKDKKLEQVQCEKCGMLFWTDQEHLTEWCPYGDAYGSHRLREDENL